MGADVRGLTHAGRTLLAEALETPSATAAEAELSHRVREEKARECTTLTSEEVEEVRLARTIRGDEGCALCDGAGAAELAPCPEGLDPALRLRVPFVAPTAKWDPKEDAPRFYDWRTVYPFLDALLPHFDAIREEVLHKATKWHAWPEQALYRAEEGDDWKVFPFVHTFPATDPSATTWLPKNVSELPRTAALLASIPGLRTALISRFGPGTSLSAHRGWAALANHVLRVHLPLVVPTLSASAEPCCGLACEGQVQYHKERDFLVFDDSKLHMAFNDHPTATRIVLIFDLVRPKNLPVGTAVGSTTDELEAFIEYFS